MTKRATKQYKRPVKKSMKKSNQVIKEMNEFMKVHKKKVVVLNELLMYFNNLPVDTCMTKQDFHKIKQDDDRVKLMLATRDSTELREVVNKQKAILKGKFDKQAKVLKQRNVSNKNFTNKMFCKAMTNLIKDFQEKVDKLKTNGKFYH